MSKVKEAKESITGYKGYDKTLKCRDHMYEIGKEYKHEGDVRVCGSGFHFCEHPLHVFAYYPPVNGNRYTSVEGRGKISREDDGDSKVAVSHIKIGGEITISHLIKASLKFIFEKVDFIKDKQTSEGNSSTAASSGDSSTAASSGYSSTAASSGYSSTAASSGDRSTAASSGYRSTAASSGYRSTAASSGDRSTAASSGDRSTAIANGKNNIAVANGIESKAQGKLGNYLVLSEYAYDETESTWNIIRVKCAMVDGKKIKEDQLYMLVAGKFKAVE